MQDAPPTAPLPPRAVSIALCLVGPVLIALLVGTYLIAPGTYLDVVLTPEVRPGHDVVREGQIVEVVTVCAGMLGVLCMVPVAWRLLRSDRRFRPAAVTTALIAAATFFFVGEELSWGQWIFGWRLEEKLRHISGSGETNLHNMDIPISIQSLGGVFLIVMFLVLPGMWRFRAHTGLSGGWAPAIAEAPVIVTIAVAFAWKEVKSVYRLLTPGHEEAVLYRDFVEQIPEQKEMLMAIGLMLYGLYRLRWRNAAALDR
jgi:uncharacterized membrane protein